MDKLWLKINIRITDREYSYETKNAGESGLTVTGTKGSIQHLDPGTMLKGMLATALAEFYASSEDSDNENAEAG